MTTGARGAICNSWSELTHCNAHLRQVAEIVKRGVWQAGGFPLELSRHRSCWKPPPPYYQRGYVWLFLQQEDGCDFDFLRSSKAHLL